MLDEILTAIRRVRSGKKYISPDLGARLMEKRLNPGPKIAHEGLSIREFEVSSDWTAEYHPVVNAP